MKAVLRGGLVAAMVGALCLSAATPVSAAQEVCAGQGNASVGSGLFYPGLGPAKNTSFGFSLDIGACSTSANLTASGSISGPLGGAHCGLSTGSGTANGHHSFSYIGAGSLLVITGGAVGVVNATPNALVGSSCTTGATQFLVTGAAALI